MLTYVAATLFILAALAISRLALAADAPPARLLPVSDAAARFLHRSLAALAAVGGVAWLTAALLILSGMRIEAHLVLALLIGALIAAVLVVIIMRGRPLILAALPGRDASVRRWQLFGVLYLGVIWLLWANSILARSPSAVWAAILSVAIVVLLPVVDRLLGRGLEQMLRPDQASDPVRRQRFLQTSRQVVPWCSSLSACSSCSTSGTWTRSC